MMDSAGDAALGRSILDAAYVGLEEEGRTEDVRTPGRATEAMRLAGAGARTPLLELMAGRPSSRSERVCRRKARIADLFVALGFEIVILCDDYSGGLVRRFPRNREKKKPNDV
jgi:hypothetical protein